ncbi:MAG: ABC transporter ATP-binding protein [Candidatus Dormiibacterota bacterium]
MSPDTAVELRGVTKVWGHQVAVDDLTFAINRGEVFGFLGPNGAGKTTTMRLMLGLVRATSGDVRLLGGSIPQDSAQILPRVGPLVETPALYPNLSGVENLRVFGAQLGGVAPEHIDELLSLVDLTSRGHDRVYKYSLGMRQRLALAVALLGWPELLVVDEPANGLDPAGIREVRSLVARIRSEGTTVFLSSHVLGEIERICDRVAILRQGKLVYVGGVEQLRQSAGEFRVEVDDLAGAVAWLQDQPWGRSAHVDGRGAVEVPSPTGRGRDLNLALTQANFPPDSLVSVQRDLEDVFLDLTAGEE